MILDESAECASIDLETLAAFMGRGFTDWVIHFGTCGTVDVERYRMSNFIAVTRVSMVLGYVGDVDWIDSAALDLVLMDWLQTYKNMRSLWARFRAIYRDLVSRTGLKAFHG